MPALAAGVDLQLQWRGAVDGERIHLPFSSSVLWRGGLVLLALVVVAVAVRAPRAPQGVQRQPIPGGPVLLRDDIALRKIVEVGPGAVKLVRNSRDGQLYFVNPPAGIFRVRLGEPAENVQVATPEVYAGGWPAAMNFGLDGTLYLVLNMRVDGTYNQATILKGSGADTGQITWTTLATTEPYPLSDTPFDHMLNGIVPSPDGRWVIVNSGSRTDHGEVEANNGAFPDLREAGITARILRLPADAENLVLPNDDAALRAQGYVYAVGTRNSFDPEFAPNGDLFAGDNGPDADFPDELNWLREGRHYGFPWRFGANDNPQQFPDYNPREDFRLSTDFTAVQMGVYRNDPTYPPPPGPFTDPVANLGPAAAQYRDDTGRPQDAAEQGGLLYTFTPHRSPLGLVFATDARLPDDLAGSDRTLSAFILSWGSSGGTLTDRGQDLLHLRLTQRGDAYFAETQQIALDFLNPIDAVMIENRLYVLDFGGAGAIWELTFVK